MADTNPAIQLDAIPLLSQIAGQGKGRVFELLQGRITFGRAEECDIVLSGEGVSRFHAYLERDEKGVYVIYDNRSKNGVLVNGARVETSVIQEGDVFQVGSYAFQFSLQKSPEQALDGIDQAVMPALSGKRKGLEGNKKRLIIYSVVGLVLVYAYWSSQQKPASEATSDQTTSSSNPTAASGNANGFQVTPAPHYDSSAKGTSIPGLEDPTLKPVEKEVNDLPWKSTGTQEAEQYFRRGQREYSDKNYHRAIDDFEAALAIDKNHPLAGYYLAAATHDAEASAKLHLENGVHYFESLQYKRAIYDFKQVILLMSHRPTDPIVAQAKKYIELCQKKLEAVEIFP